MTVKEASPTLRGTTGVLRVPDVRRTTRADWAQLVRFLVVGVSGYVVNLAVFTMLVAVGDWHYAAAAAAAFCVAWLNNFVLNRYWTFRAVDRPALSQGLRYFLVCLVALAANLLILHGLVVAGMAETPAQAIAIIAVTPLNFLLSRRWSFR